MGPTHDRCAAAVEGRIQFSDKTAFATYVKSRSCGRRRRVYSIFAKRCFITAEDGLAQVRLQREAFSSDTCHLSIGKLEREPYHSRHKGVLVPRARDAACTCLSC